MATSTNESDLHAESDHEESATTPKSLKKKRTTRTYNYHSQYDNLAAAHDIIMAGFDDGYEWRPYRKVANSTGSTNWYRCVYSAECPRIQLLHNTVTNVVTIHRDEEEHSHPTVIAGALKP
jgi:hypothetical protein